jgi:hypothetical protein
MLSDEDEAAAEEDVDVNCYPMHFPPTEKTKKWVRCYNTGGDTTISIPSSPSRVQDRNVRLICGNITQHL